MGSVCWLVMVVVMVGTERNGNMLIVGKVVVGVMMVG